MGAGIPGSKNGKPALPKFKKSSPIPAGVPMPKGPKAKNGTSLGMKSVKAGYDSNPGVTRADIISAAKMKTGKAQHGAKVVAKKPIKKAQDGLKAVDLPEYTKKSTSLRPMEIALGDDRKMSIDTVGYKSPATMRNETFNYTVSDKSGKVIRKDKLQSGPGESRVDIVSRMAKDLDSGKMKRPAFKKGGKVLAKKPIKKAQNGEKTKMVVDGKEYVEGAMLPEAVVTAKPIKAPKSKPSNSYKAIIRRSNKMNKNQSGFSRMNPRKRFEEGGEVSMAKKGASVKKAMGKCKMGC